MKKLATLLLMLLPMLASAQSDAIKEMCGVKYGATFDHTLKSLRNKFGEPLQVTKDDCIMYQDFAYDGMSFSSASFWFGHKSSLTNTGPIIFHQVIFMTACSTADEADAACLAMAKWMKRKYSIERKVVDGKIAFYGGENPVNDALVGFSIRYEEFNGSYLSILTIWPNPFID